MYLEAIKMTPSYEKKDSLQEKSAFLASFCNCIICKYYRKNKKLPSGKDLDNLIKN